MISEHFNMSSISQHELIKICYLYYIEGQTQQQISSAFGFSRFKTSRLLKKAREEGLVTIRINDPTSDLTEMEVELARKYSLKQAIVVKIQKYNDKSQLSQIGEAGARYLSGIIHQCKVLGIAWGRSISYVVQNVEQFEANDLTVVQMTGGMGAIAGTDANALTMALGQKLGAICGRFFDISGQKCTNELDDQIIGLNLNELKKINHKVAIAFGPEKVKAILGAMRGHFLDVLITDDKTANALLEIS